ncbi:hypothetical protein J31TS4_02040 [Paenibacillus sp. J31TS4]|uniref:DUF342 domain-containing protein n=1 Tax=Paenibacillus sp. J31TS4 TaxID=2807195 RepID=UPI001B0ACA0C|nr:FapA family protein [Paenibacillus sp. J31TS4]GIP36924.1 hypothetical protein J31TS4_02040 [Paenibacillus sp. J31TS4]
MTKKITENELTLLIKQLNLEELDVDSVITEMTREEEDNLQESTLMQDGWIQVKEHKIIVHDPIDGGKLPVISALPPIKLKINGVKVESKAAVSSSDHIHWEIDEKALFDIKITDDKLSAYFRLYSKERYAWRLVDTEALSRIILTAEEDRNTVLETVHLGDIAATLEQKSIKSNLDLASIHQELAQPTYQPILVAKGKAAVSGKDAQLEVYFSEQVENQFFEIAGSVDFRNHLQIPSVNKGEMIAKKIPMVDGIPGYDVFGNVIMPVPSKDIFVVVKSGVELTPDGEIIARKVGRPRITGDGIKTFDISTSYIVSGDVNIETGNVVFSGDIIICGNVTDSMIVESLGNVYVYGSVFNATITATGSIHVRGNVLGSKLYSGYFGVMFNRLYHSSKTLSEHIEKLLAAARMLEQALESRQQTIRFGQIVLILMESKLKDIPTAVRELLTVISNIQHIKKEEYQKLVEMSGMIFQPAKLLETATYSFFQSFLALLRDTHQEVARMQEEKVQIMINQCHNSELKSNGDIIIQQDGVLLSDLYSAGNILFLHDSAVCRGAKLEAEGVISAKVVGGQTGVNTLLKAKKQIKIKKMYAGRLCVGRYCKDIYDVVENKTFDAYNMKQSS